MKIALLTGGDDPNYAIPLTAALISKNVKVDFIGNDTMKSFDLFSDHRVRYLNLRGDQSESAAIFEKARRILFYYCRLLTYVAKTDKKIIHILWLNKFKHLDRILMNIYYKLNMKKVILTVHNVNTEARDGKDSFFNRMTLKFMYRIVDHLIVHTSKMKNDLIESFGINPDKITEIKFGLNDYIPQTGLSGGHSRKILGLSEKNKIILFFGRIAPYKGLDLLAKSLRPVVNQYPETKLVIAGKIERNCEHYWYPIEKIIDQNALDEFVVKKVNFIPEDEIEIFLKRPMYWYYHIAVFFKAVHFLWHTYLAFLSLPLMSVHFKMI